MSDCESRYYASDELSRGGLYEDKSMRQSCTVRWILSGRAWSRLDSRLCRLLLVGWGLCSSFRIMRAVAVEYEGGGEYLGGTSSSNATLETP